MAGYKASKLDAPTSGTRHQPHGKARLSVKFQSSAAVCALPHLNSGHHCLIGEWSMPAEGQPGGTLSVLFPG